MDPCEPRHRRGIPLHPFAERQRRSNSRRRRTAGHDSKQCWAAGSPKLGGPSVMNRAIEAPKCSTGIKVDLRVAAQDPSATPRSVGLQQVALLVVGELLEGPGCVGIALQGESEESPRDSALVCNGGSRELRTPAQMERRPELLRDPALSCQKRFRPQDELTPVQARLHRPPPVSLLAGEAKLSHHVSANGDGDRCRRRTVARAVRCDCGQHMLPGAHFLRIPRELPRRARQRADEDAVDVVRHRGDA